MPRGPKGEKRPGDVLGNAVHVMRIAEDRGATSKPANCGLVGGKVKQRR